MFNKKRKIQELLNNWGKPVNRFRDFELINTFHEFEKNNSENEFVDDKTWTDLEFDRIFEKLDRNTSPVGQQYLYNLLHKYETDDTLHKRRKDQSRYFIENESDRLDIQLILSDLDKFSSHFIPSILYDENLPHTKYYYIFYALAVFSLLSFALIPFKGVFLFVALAVMLVNIIINKIHSTKIYDHFTGFKGLNNLMIAARKLSCKKTKIPIPEIEKIKSKASLIKSLNKKLGKLVVDKNSLPELAGVLIEYLNLILMFDVIAYYRSINILMKHREEIRDIFDCIGELDSQLSLASFMSSHTMLCTPDFTNDDHMSFKNVYHPLIHEAVSNSISELDTSILVTGSNMAGKTTFIKTVGLNVILGQTLGICFAEKFTSTNFIVKSSIRREENLEESKSYFFVEIEELNKFIKLSQTETKYLFLIDEIFRGTNTVERIASSTAVLKYLNNDNLVFVTTHDIELQYLLQEFKMYHFSEQVEGNKFFFDYKIKEGPCTSGNAIKLLELQNYPSAITIEASDLAKKLLTSNILDIENLKV